MFAAKIFPIKTVCTAYKNSIVRLRIHLLSCNKYKCAIMSAFRDRGSLGRRMKCRRVPQPRWVGARRSAKGGKRQPERERGGNPAAFVFVPHLGRVRLQ
jgi:hypothetical protein